MSTRIRLSCNHLTLPLFCAGGGGRASIFLVDAVDALVLSRDGEYESVSNWQVVWAFQRESRSLAWEISRFASRSGLIGLGEAWLSERDRAEQVLAAIERGDLVGIRPRPAKTAPDTDSTREQQRLARQIAALGRLVESGRQYKLVAGADLNGIADRNSYEVVPRDEARRVLDSLTRQSAGPPGLPPLLGQAVAKLSPDWRPPLAPSGLVLLRRIQAVRVASATPEAAMTPSQMRARVEEATLEIHVVDLKQKPQEGLAFAIKAPDGSSVSGKLDKEGRGRAQSTLPGTFAVTFPELDGADWDGDGTEELPPEEDRTEVSKYDVEPGDRLPTIAHDKGFARWQTIWDFAGNKALKDLRGNAHILLPGDQVAIPSKVKRKAEVPGGTAEYVVQTAAERLHVRFAGVISSEDDPVTFKVTPDTGGAIEGVLRDNGWLDIDLPSDTSTVKVELFRSDAGEEENDDGGPDGSAGSEGADGTSEPEPFASYEFTVGGLDPFDAISGIQARLFNLGFYDGAITGELDDDTGQAISHFRWAALRDGKSENDAVFRNALRKAHGS